jgi:hypothetical protein
MFVCYHPDKKREHPHKGRCVSLMVPPHHALGGMGRRECDAFPTSAIFAAVSSPRGIAILGTGVPSPKVLCTSPLHRGHLIHSP